MFVDEWYLSESTLACHCDGTRQVSLVAIFINPIPRDRSLTSDVLPESSPF